MSNHFQVCGKVRPDCELGHKCKKTCFKDCGPCPDPVKKVIPGCGHTQTMNCGMEPENFKCRESCEKMRDCGHRCNLLCGVDCSDSNSPATRCTVEVERKLPCGHIKKIPCFWAQRALDQVCKAKCEAILDCGHPCTGNCGECDGDRLHQGCGQVCARPLICGHKCREMCGLPCHCREQCGTRCGHNKCQVRTDIGGWAV